MRPIAYGIVVFFGSAVLWVLFSVIGAFIEFGSGTRELMPIVTLCFTGMFFSLPVAIIVEIIQWIRRRRHDT